MKIARHIACLFAGHVCALATLHRINDERVEARCSRCGRTLHATHGLAIRCRWTQPFTTDNAAKGAPHDR